MPKDKASSTTAASTASQLAQNDAIEMADACVQTHSSQAGDNQDTDELEVQTASVALNLTDDAIAMSYFSDYGFDNISELVCVIYFFRCNILLQGSK